jgi:hypothetical protein
VNILLINLEFDCAGVSWQLREAINRYTPHIAKHVTRRHTMAAQNTDRLFERIDEISDLCEWADVLHFNQWIWTYQPGQPFAFQPKSGYGSGHPFEEFFKPGKKIIFHFHGGPLQLNPGYWVDECKRVGARILKCDPYSMIEGAEWIPNILDIDEIPHKPFSERNLADPRGLPFVSIMGGLDDTRRINRLIRESLEYLRQFFQFDYGFFGTVPRAMALTARSNYQISIDNTTQGFIGMWGWESLALGQALIARFHPDVLSAYEELGPEIPVYDANNIDDVACILRMLFEDPEELRDACRLSREWMLKYYHAERLVKRYVDAYAG